MYDHVPPSFLGPFFAFFFSKSPASASLSFSSGFTIFLALVLLFHLRSPSHRRSISHRESSTHHTSHMPGTKPNDPILFFFMIWVPTRSTHGRPDRRSKSKTTDYPFQSGAVICGFFSRNLHLTRNSHPIPITLVSCLVHGLSSSLFPLFLVPCSS